MGSPFDQTTVVMGPPAASKFGVPADEKRPVRHFVRGEEDDGPDPRVEWANEKEAQLKDECADVRTDQRKARAYYRGNQTFNLAKRPRWMHAIVDNQCLAAGTRVSTEYGLCKIEDVEPCNSTEGRITALSHKGTKPVIRLVTDRGLRIVCTPDHKVRTLCEGTNDDWTEAKDTLGKSVRLRQPQFASRYVVENGTEITEKWGRWFGYYMGDGWCSSSGPGICAFSHDLDVVEDITSLQTELMYSMPVAPRGRVAATGPYIRTKNNCTIVQVDRVAAVKWLRGVGAANGKRIICVPDCIFRSPQSVVREFLRGLFEADGHCSTRQRQVGMTAKDRSFLEDVNLLLLGFGIHGRIIKQKQSKPVNGVLWELYLGSSNAVKFMADIGFISKRKNDKFPTMEGRRVQWTKEFHYDDKVVAIEDAGTTEVYDVSVDTSHQFVANGIVVHNCFLTVERWSAMLTDNKPKVVFAAYNPKDQLEADIANAAFNDDYVRYDYQGALERAVKLSRIEKKAYVRQYYDPSADQHRGAIRWMAVSGTQVYVNAEAASVDDAQVLLYEYYEPKNKVLGLYPKLKNKLKSDLDTKESTERGGKKLAPAGSQRGLSEGSSVPGGAPGDNFGSTTYTPPYAAGVSPPQQSSSSSVRMREWWLRHPTRKTQVKRIVWTVGGEPATEAKAMQFYDAEGNPEHKEPLMTVVTEGNVVYELPMSIALLLEHVGKHFGGLDVIAMTDARKVVTEKVTVPLYPGGRRLLLADDQVASDGMNPFVDGHWPFAEIDAHSDGTSYYGKSDVDIIWPLQDGKNRLLSQIMDAAHLTANPIWRLPIGRRTPNETITNAPGAIIDEDLPSLRYGKREKGPEMPGYVMQTMQYYDGRMQALTGLTDVAMGGKMKGNQAAETVSMYQDAASLPARQGIRNVERAIVKLGYQWISLSSQFYSEPRWVAVKNAIGKDNTKMFIGTHLTADMVVRAKAGSMLPQSPAARLASVIQVMQTPYGTVEPLAEALEEVGMIDSASDFIGNLEKYVKAFKDSGGNPVALWGAPGLLALLGGGGSKKKAPNNAGRTARARTPRAGG